MEKVVRVGPLLYIGRTILDKQNRSHPDRTWRTKAVRRTGFDGQKWSWGPVLCVTILAVTGLPCCFASNVEKLQLSPAGLLYDLNWHQLLMTSPGKTNNLISVVMWTTWYHTLPVKSSVDVFSQTMHHTVHTYQLEKQSVHLARQRSPRWWKSVALLCPVFEIAELRKTHTHTHTYTDTRHTNKWNMSMNVIDAKM